MQKGDTGEMSDAPRTDGPPPQLSRPLEDEVRNPFDPVDPAPRRPLAPPPAPRPVAADPFAPPFARDEEPPPPVPSSLPPAPSTLLPRVDRDLLPPGGGSTPLEGPASAAHEAPVVAPAALGAPPVAPPAVDAASVTPAALDPSPGADDPTAPPWRTATAAATAPAAPPAGEPPRAEPAPVGPTAPTAPLLGGALFSSGSPTGPPVRPAAADPLDEIAFPPRAATTTGTSLFRPTGAPVAPAPAPAPDAAGPVPVATPFGMPPAGPGAMPPPGFPPPGPQGFAPGPQGFAPGPQGFAPGPQGFAPGPPGVPPPGMPPWPGAGLPPGPTAPPRSRGSRLALLGGVAAAVLVVLLAVVVVGPRLLGTTDDAADAATPETTEPPHPDVWDERVAPIAEWVATERALEFEHPVTVRFLSEEDYQAEAEGEAGEDATSEEAEEEAEHYAGLWRALGLAHGEVDFETAGETLQGEGTLAYYTPQEQVVYVRGTELTPGVRVTLAHELTHVLQDQHFDLERMADPDFDRSEGLRALAEGDAERIEEAYIADRLTPDERTAYDEETAAAGEDAEAALDEDVPPALVAFFSAPYALGSTIVDRLTRLEGPAAIDGLLEDPPTEEELLDPSSRGTVRADVQEVEVRAPEGAEQVEEDVVGPVAWYLMLASRGEPIDALRAVDGWGGDAMVSYRHDGATCVRAVAVGDDAAGTDALAAAIESWIAAGPDGAASVEVDEGRVRFQACDPGADAPSTGEVSTDLLSLPVVRTELTTQLEESGWPAEAARCGGDRVAGLFPLEVLASPNPPTPEQTAQIQQAVLACR